MTTTLNKIKKYSPCEGGLQKLLTSLAKTELDDEPITLIYILESNGIDDAIWCLRCVNNCDKEIKLFTLACIKETESIIQNGKNVNIVNIKDKLDNSEIIAIKAKNIDTATNAIKKASSISVMAWEASRELTANAVWTNRWEEIKEKQIKLFIYFFEKKITKKY